VTPEDYRRRKAFLALFLERQVLPPMPPEFHPIAVLEATEPTSPAQAARGLQMALNDVVEMSIDWPLEQLTAFDAELMTAGAITLSELRAESSRLLRAVERRGRIRNPVELYLVKGVVDGAAHTIAEERLVKLQVMLDSYEGLG
jgi:hypothetical protein